MERADGNNCTRVGSTALLSHRTHCHPFHFSVVAAVVLPQDLQDVIRFLGRGELFAGRVIAAVYGCVGSGAVVKVKRKISDRCLNPWQQPRRPSGCDDESNHFSIRVIFFPFLFCSEFTMRIKEMGMSARTLF